MQITLYLDIIFCINTLANYIVLWITSCIMKEKTSMLRLFAGALTGAGLLILFLCLPRRYPVITGVASFVGISMGTIFITFGRIGFIRKWFCSTTIMFLTGSIMNYVKMITNQTVLTFCCWLFLFMAAILVTAFLVYAGRKNARVAENFFTVLLHNADKQVYCKVFLDTGNLLKDPLFGKPVLLVSKTIAEGCLNEEGCRMIEMYEKEKKIDYSQMLKSNAQQKNCFHEIAFCSVGNPSGRLLCFLVDELKVEGKTDIHRKQPVAVAPSYLFQETEYQGLIHRECL